MIYLFLLIFVFISNITLALCPFCDPDILSTQTFYEESLVRAFYTHRPIVPAHFLIIPKRHIESFEELSSEELLQVQKVIDKVHHMSQKVYLTSAYLIHQKNGEEVGQSVPHLHFHYIGKQKGDSSSIKFTYNMILSQIMPALNKKELIKTTELLKNAMSHKEK